MRLAKVRAATFPICRGHVLSYRFLSHNYQYLYFQWSLTFLLNPTAPISFAGTHPTVLDVSSSSCLQESQLLKFHIFLPYKPERWVSWPKNVSLFLFSLLIEVSRYARSAFTINFLFSQFIYLVIRNWSFFVNNLVLNYSPSPTFPLFLSLCPALSQRDYIFNNIFQSFLLL